MADPLEFPGPEGPSPDPAPEADLPADFFDDLPGSPPAPGPAFSSASPVASVEGGGTALDVPDLAAPEAPALAAPDPVLSPVAGSPPVGAPVLPVALGLVLIVAMSAAVLLGRRPAQAPPATAAPVEALAEEVQGVKAQVGGLSGQVGGLSGHVKSLRDTLDRLPRPAPPPDLAPVRDKLDDLGKRVAVLDELPGRLEALAKGVADLGGEVKAARDASSALGDELKKTTAAVAALEARPAPEPPPDAGRREPTHDPAAETARGVELFRAGKVKEADEVFQSLAAEGPRDARVYYYAALTHGLTTRDWQNETLKLAARGAELEKSGAPPAQEIDAAFSDLPANLKPWLTYFRSAAR